MKEKIKVLFFISSLAGGGAERVTVDILSHIDKDKIDPTLLLLYPFNASPYKEYLPEDVRVSVVERKSDSFLEKVNHVIHFMEAVRREKPQVIVSALTHNNIMAILAGIVFSIRVITCEHITLGDMIRTREGRRILGLPVTPLVKILYRFADQIVAVSEGIRDNLVEEFNAPADKIKVICNPIDFKRITELWTISPEHPFFEERAPVVVAAGRLVSQKGFDILIKAFCMVLSEMDVRLIILGEGSEAESLKKLSEDRGITSKVSFVGFQKNPYNFLSRADLFVLSSRYEGLPMVMLEAMACGIPVVSTNCRSGPREILQNGRCGLLVPVGDVNALSEAIVRLLKDRELRGNLSRLARERAKDFSLSKIVRKYEEMICKSVLP
jgi:glycosyltransferase involved in cell wall biosynthesis